MLKTQDTPNSTASMIKFRIWINELKRLVPTKYWSVDIGRATITRQPTKSLGCSIAPATTS